MTHPGSAPVDPLLIDTITRLLADVATADEVERAETDGGWSRATWSALHGAGFTQIGISEERGGSGGSVADVAAVLLAAGRAAAAVPLAETTLIAGWALAEAGIDLPAGPVSALTEAAHIVDGNVHVSGTAAWGRHAERIVAVTADDLIVVLRNDQIDLAPGANLAGEARDRVDAEVPLGDTAHAIVESARLRLLERGALSRVIMAAGALESVARMTVDYAHDRHQFGRPVARFQAVQQHLVNVAQSAARARMAADVATSSLSSGVAGLDIAAARVVTDDAITVGTRSAHQAHGAMGVTREYRLHQFTRRLWSWRHEWESTSFWRRQVGRSAAEGGADHLFDLITN